MSSTVSGLELQQWRTTAQQQAIAAQVSPSEVDWLLQEIAGLDRLSLRLESFTTKTEIPLKFSLAQLTQLWQQRLNEHLPIQYIVGHTHWRNFSLMVSPAVLIPRPETEEIIDIAIAAVQKNPDLGQGTWVDLGTGSGAIARIQFHQGKWFEPIASRQLSGMISNPPYIPRTIIPTLQPEVAQHEPRLALDGGEDGLDCIRHLVNTAADYLRSGGVWMVEMMAGQAEAVTQLLRERGEYGAIEVHVDLNGIERFVSAIRV
jgi:release factor glutamine methyltransferase